MTTTIEDDGLRAMRLIDNGIAYEIPAGEFSTLMAHGWLARVGDGTFRLSHDHELLADPGSAGVRNPDPLAVAAVVRAALRSSPAVDGVGVKPLVWHKHQRDDLERYNAEPPFASYIITWTASGYDLYIGFWGSAAEPRPEPFRTLDEAKSAAQKDYETRVRSALSPTSDSASVVEAGPDIDMARHWIDRYAAGIDEEPQMDRIIAALSPRSS